MLIGWVITCLQSWTEQLPDQEPRFSERRRQAEPQHSTPLRRAGG